MTAIYKRKTFINPYKRKLLLEKTDNANNDYFSLMKCTDIILSISRAEMQNETEARINVQKNKF